MRPQLVIQTAFLGDLVLSFPLFQALKEEFPNSPLYVICRKGLGDFVKKSSYADKVLEVEKGDSSSYKQVVDDLKSIEFEYLLSPHLSVRSALLSAKIFARNKISYRTFWNFLFFQERVNRNLNYPEVLRLLTLMRPISKKYKKYFEELPEVDYRFVQKAESQIDIKIPDWSKANVPQELGDISFLREAFSYALIDKKNKYDEKKIEKIYTGQFVILFPGSVWPTKRWKKEGFIELGEKILKKGYDVILMGSSDEKELCTSIQSEIQKHLIKKCQVGEPEKESVIWNMAGILELWRVLALIKRSSLVVCNDSASQHLSSLVNTPVVSIFGPTVLDFGYRPWTDQCHIVETNLPCRPCGKHGSEKCPIGTHQCMNDISVQQVFDFVIKWLH